MMCPRHEKATSRESRTYTHNTDNRHQRSNCFVWSKRSHCVTRSTSRQFMCNEDQESGWNHRGRIKRLPCVSTSFQSSRNLDTKHEYENHTTASVRTQANKASARTWMTTGKDTNQWDKLAEQSRRQSQETDERQRRVVYQKDLITKSTVRIAPAIDAVAAPACSTLLFCDEDLPQVVPNNTGRLGSVNAMPKTLRLVVVNHWSRLGVEGA